MVERSGSDSLIQIGIAAPTPALRAGLAAMLQSPLLEPVAQAGSLLLLAARHVALDAVVVADETLLLDLDDLDLRELTSAVLVMSEQASVVATLAASGLRGWGVVVPDATPETLQAATVAVAQGLVVLPPALAASTARLAQVDVPVADALPQESLTAREQEVLVLLSQGLANKQIARVLQISEHTVKFHISSLYAKLGVASRTEAVSQGVRRGLVSF